MIALQLIIALLLVGDICTYLCLQTRFKAIEAKIAAINEDLAEMDTDLEEVFDHLFPEEIKEELDASDESGDQGQMGL